jgi:DNA-binding CsgD family transcriptional regulator
MVFVLDTERSARSALSIGNIPIGPDLGAAYSGHFHLADPNRDTILRERSAGAAIMLPKFSRRMYGDSYRKLFFEDAEIVDKVASATWVGNTCFYVNLYRTAGQGRFDRTETMRLRRIAPALGAIVARHCEEEVAADPLQKLHILFATRQPFTKLTAREREVCVRILTGFGSEAIASDLGIGLHSTFTYRKRAYQKLGISSQNELFAIALRLMAMPKSEH